MKEKNAFNFIEISPRTNKPRTKGLTMFLDKGLGLNQSKDLMQAASYIDIIKLGWATPRLLLERDILAKIALYKENDILVGNGGTFLEIAYKQNRVDDFFNYCRDIGMGLIEVSNGVMPMTFKEKAGIIHKANQMGFYVISEVGKKDPAEDRKLSLEDRVKEAKNDLSAGAHYVIIEAREAGKDIGVFDDRGSLKEDMAKNLMNKIGFENIMFEAPEKSQQARLILLFGADVNLGNIRPEDVIPLETLRRGIRGDTLGKL